jgi:hypothetical protein
MRRIAAALSANILYECLNIKQKSPELTERSFRSSPA